MSKACVSTGLESHWKRSYKNLNLTCSSVSVLYSLIGFEPDKEAS